MGDWTLEEIVLLLLVGFWAPAAVCVAAYWFFRRLERREQKDREEKRPRDDYYRISDQLDHMMRELSTRIERSERYQDESRHLLPKIVESATEELRYRTGALFHDLEREMKSLEAGLRGRAQVAQIGFPGDGQLIRELSHALNTPLSQVEAAALTLIAGGNPSESELKSRLKTIRDGVDICKSILTSFREVILSTKAATAWAPESLSASVESAIRFYPDLNKKQLSAKVDLPQEIQGYSTNYILSLLLPLIENAVEAATEGTEISITARKQENKSELLVANAAKQPPEGDIYLDGFTTKTGHSGTGLSIVMHLLSSVSGASLTHEVRGTEITFKIELPGRT
jgi:signal transduction histidine kinase